MTFILSDRQGMPINVCALLSQRTLFPPSHTGKECRFSVEWLAFQPEGRGRARS
jgi:hypothetical protein